MFPTLSNFLFNYFSRLGCFCSFKILNLFSFNIVFVLGACILNIAGYWRINEMSICSLSAAVSAQRIILNHVIRFLPFILLCPRDIMLMLCTSVCGCQ